MCRGCSTTKKVLWRTSTRSDFKEDNMALTTVSFPGLGIELDEEAAARHPKQDHWLRHYAGTLTNVRPPDSVRYWRPAN